MRGDVLTWQIILLITFLSLSLANNPFFADDSTQAPFEVAAAGPILGIVDPDPDPNGANFGLLPDVTFATDSAALDSLPAPSDQVIVAGGAQQQNLPQKKKNDNLPPTWIRKEPGGPGKGAPKPSNPKIPEGVWGRYPGYPSENTNLDDLYELDPNSRERLRFKKQPKGHCDEGFHLFCCRPLLILCYTFHDRWPECIPSQQKCCEKVDIFFNGISCRDATEPNEGTESNDENHPDRNEYHNDGPNFVLPFTPKWPNFNELIPGV